MPSTALAADTGLPSTNPLDRRSFLATLAAAGVMTGGATLGAEAGPIEQAYAGWVHASRLSDDAWAVTCDIEERYEEPARPSWHPFKHEGGYKKVLVGESRCRCYLDDSAENIAHLRQIIDAPETFFTDMGWTPEMFPPRVEAAKRTLAEILTWQAEAQRRADACGLTTAREREKPLTADANARRRAILDAKPTTLREAAFQGALLSIDWDDLAASHLCEALRTLAGIPAYDEETTDRERDAA